MKRFFDCSCITLSIVLLGLMSCNTKQNSSYKLILDAKYKNIKSIHTIADCKGPGGAYTTEVKSELDGSCVFIQQPEDSNTKFHVQITQDEKGYVLDDQKKIVDTLAFEDVVMIKGHEFHKLHSNPSHFFDEIHYEKTINDEFDLYKAKDRLSNPVRIMYNTKHKLIYKVDLLNPRDTTEVIEIINTLFVDNAFGKMVKELEIIQAKKDTFHFNFKSIKVN